MEHDILQRYIEGNACQEEQEDVAKWLDADEQNMQEFLLLRNIYDVSIWNQKESFLKIEEKKSLAKNEANRRRKIKILQEFIKVAVIFLFAFGCYHLFISPKLDTTNSNLTLQTIHVPEGQRAEAILSDGTKVWLNAKSTLTFPNQFEETHDRTVELDGEAYFDVTHHESKRFIVKTKTYQIKVYGTEFNVNAYHNSDDFETALIKGSVEVASTLMDDSILLSPNSRVYTENNKLVLDEIETMDQFLWKKGILSFEKQKIEELFQKLELYYDVKIEVKNKKILAHQYSGKFWTKDGVEHVLKVLQLRHDFKYTKDNMNNIIIY